MKMTPVMISTRNFIFIVMLYIPVLVWSQDRPDIDSLFYKGKALCMDYPDSSLLYLMPAYQKSVSEDYYWGIVNTAQFIAEAHYFKGNLDSSNVYDRISLKMSTEEGDQAEIANSLVSLAFRASEVGNHDEAADYYIKAQHIMEERKDTVDLEDIHLRIGYMFISQDKLEQAMFHFKQGHDYALALKDSAYIAYGLSGMSYVHKKMKNTTQAIQLSLESTEYLRAIGDIHGLIGDFNNRGIMYKDIDSFDLAIQSYDSVIYYAEKVNSEYGAMTAGINMGILYNIKREFNRAVPSLEKALDIAYKLDSPIAQADAILGLSEARAGQGLSQLSISLAKEGLVLADSLSSLEKKLKGNEILASVTEVAYPTESINYLKNVQILKDSIFNIDKAKQIDELQTQYETTKKDAEISLLNKNAEIDSTRKKALSIGLILLLVSAVSIIYAILQKRKKEKELAAEKLSSANRELEFKKKELTAKALQLARKNEFLHELEQEVTELHSSVDNAVGRTSTKITRMIQRDMVDDESWEQFGKEFSSVHQEFLNRLREQYGKFTKGEMRLISLMRMNMTSKDIASTLGVSDEGIKKARYRLRKKMNLDSSDDIQGIIVGL